MTDREMQLDSENQLLREELHNLRALVRELIRQLTERLELGEPDAHP